MGALPKNSVVAWGHLGLKMWSRVTAWHTWVKKPPPNTSGIEVLGLHHQSVRIIILWENKATKASCPLSKIIYCSLGQLKSYCALWEERREEQECWLSQRELGCFRRYWYIQTIVMRRVRSKSSSLACQATLLWACSWKLLQRAALQQPCINTGIREIMGNMED